jgi:hypothetical protein
MGSKVPTTPCPVDKEAGFGNDCAIPKNEITKVMQTIKCFILFYLDLWNVRVGFGQRRCAGLVKVTIDNIDALNLRSVVFFILRIEFFI